MEVDPGVQPIEDERLRCLECDNWYRQLPPHLRAVHDLSGAEYRERHQLPTRVPLRAPDLQRRASDQGKDRYANRPDIRQYLEDGRAAQDRAASVPDQIRTARYPAVREARRRGGAGRHDKALAEADARAQALGFADLAAYLTARADTSLNIITSELGMGRTPIRRWYARLNITRPRRAHRTL